MTSIEYAIPLGDCFSTCTAEFSKYSLIIGREAGEGGFAKTVPNAHNTLPRASLPASFFPVWYCVSGVLKKPRIIGQPLQMLQRRFRQRLIRYICLCLLFCHFYLY